MKKRSVPTSNHFCPQSLFLYGTYKEDGAPNFGLFCWFSYYWDSELRVMCCIGGEKLTKDRIRATGIFSANLVAEPLLPLADRLGNTEGYDAAKAAIPLETAKGAVLDVPVLEGSPWSFELEVDRSVRFDDGDVFFCKVRNVLADERLADENVSVAERMKLARPVLSTAHSYFSVNPAPLGGWGDWMKG